MKAKKTKEFFLSQALLLFRQKGYEAVTMRDIATACDSSLGSFYYHFANKEEIVLELYRASLSGHIERTRQYLASHDPKLETAMTWICRDRFEEFEPYRAVLRVLVQRLDPHDPVSPWHSSSQKIRAQSVALFEELVTGCLPKLEPRTRRQLARALWIHHLVILAAWSFDRSRNSDEIDAILRSSRRLWRSVPALVRVPGMKTVLHHVLSPLERFEGVGR